MSVREKIIIIVAGGKGERMGTAVPKQFLLLNGKPILMHTIDVFHAFNVYMKIIVALPVQQKETWKSLCATYRFDVPHQVVSGGETRWNSVKNALAFVPSGCIVGVHDGVRPLVSREVIERCFSTAEAFPAVIPVLPLSDSIREINPQTQQNKPVDRSHYRLVQTPQVFQSEILLQAYRMPCQPGFTDDASVAGQYCEIRLVDGNPENIKITTREDLTIAEALLNPSPTCQA
ncbi:MAG: 2-C-methyl-D-erythritol 4-phosphate cytidylyltransferase [Dysgonamonadaceae bacterium]|jgi:2-C-methyl-D-erythritol 4-phosphate cytidylyltransferase|nr:2-C-methyl-D-erythritol 4-phosphate cytidylyltransferase [Dysgonamonadaceae bacterium]